MPIAPPHFGSGAWYPVFDPVCGRQVEPVPIAYHCAHGEEDYFFCSIRCAKRFRSDPDAYVQRLASATQPDGAESGLRLRA